MELTILTPERARTRVIGGVQFTVARPDEAVRAIHHLATSGEAASVHLANAYTVSLAREDPRYAQLLRRSAFTFADSKWVSVVSKRGGGPRVEQVRGPKLFEESFARHDPNVRHFLLGGTNELLDALKRNLLSAYPLAQIVGELSPPFRELTAQDITQQDRAIVASGANLVWVGLGTPKQDLEVDRLARHLGVTAVAVGAAFDFVAGTKKAAPEFVSRIGMEWLFRLATEPRRLWRRYFFGNLGFLRALVSPPE